MHPTDDALEALSLGTSSSLEFAELERHLQICPFCRGRLQETEDFVRTLRIALVYRELKGIKSVYSQEEERSLPLWKRRPDHGLLRLDLVTLKWEDAGGADCRAIGVVEYASPHGIFLRLLSRIPKDTVLTILRPRVELRGVVRYWEYRSQRHYVGIRYTAAVEQPAPPLAARLAALAATTAAPGLQR